MPGVTDNGITCIAEIDALVACNDELPHGAVSSLKSFERRFLEISPMHGQLLHIKHLHRGCPAVEQQFNARRGRQLSGNTVPQSFYMRGYERAFGDLSHQNSHCFGYGRIRRFIDLGCSPGGFSNWLLKSNPDAEGVGITLPNQDAKYRLVTENTCLTQPRYHVRFENIITLAMSAVARGENPIIALDGANGEPEGGSTSVPFDLVVAGAFPTLEGPIPWWLRVQLTLSQILIVLGNTAPGGSCVVVINTKPFRWMAEVISLLRQSFRVVTAGKGALHQIRTSCYLVCTQFHASSDQVADYTRRIRNALQKLEDISLECRVDPAGPDTGDVKLGIPGLKLHIRGQCSDGMEMPLLLDGTDDEVFEAEHRFILDLFEPLWRLQFNAIHDNLAHLLHAQADSDEGAPMGNSPASAMEKPPTPPPSPPMWRGRRVSERYASQSPTQSKISTTFSPIQSGSASSPRSWGHPSPIADNEMPPSPRWRPPQRRTSYSGPAIETSNWRTKRADGPPDLNGIEDAGAREEKLGRIFTQRRTSAASETSNWWRGK